MRSYVRFIAICFTALIAVLFLVGSSYVHAANLTVNAAQRFQTIEGLGVNVNVDNWNNGQLKSALDFLVATHGSSQFRVIRDPMDWVSSESLIPALHALTPTTLQQVYETPRMQDIWNTIGYLNQIGISGRRIILNFMGWTPTWMGGSGTYGAPSHITLGKEQSFATMVASLVYYGKKVKGLDFTYLSPTNEQDQNACIESPCLDPVQYTTVMHLLSDELDYMGINDVRFVVPDTGAVIVTSPAYITQIMADPTVAARTDHFSIHDYSGYPVAPGTAYPGKNYWVTETSTWCTACDVGGSGPTNEWDFDKQTTDIVLGDLKNGFSVVLIWEGYDSFWYHHNASSLWGLLTYNASTGIYTPRKRAYAYAHFNRFIGPGDVVIGLSESIGNVPTAVAVYNATTGKVAIVGRNSGSSPVTVSGQLSNLPTINTLALYETGASVNLVRRADIAVAGGLFTVQISADSIFTLTTMGTTPDLQPPTVALSSPLSGSQVSGTVTVSAEATDNVGVAGVRFVLDGAPLGQESNAPPYAISLDTTTLANGGHTLSAAARDAAGNETISMLISITVNNDGSTPPVISLVKSVSGSTTSAVSLAVTLPSVTVGNLIVVSVSGWPNLPTASPVSDNLGNSYNRAGNIYTTQGAYSAIYYTKNSKAGTAVITFSTVASDGQISMVVAEFSGVDLSAPVDAVAGTTGSGNMPSSGTMTPTRIGDLLVGSGTHNGNTTTNPGTGFTMISVPTEDSVSHQPLAMEYRIMNAQAASATFSLSTSLNWAQNGVLFKPGVPTASDTTPPSVPIGFTATVVSTTQIYLSWAPSNDPVVSGQATSGISGYRIFRNGSAIGTTTLTSYPDTGLSVGTTYTYAVSAMDAANNSSAQSGSVSATTLMPDTTPPVVSITSPANGSTVSGTTTVSAAASDNVGVARVEFYLNGVLQLTDTASPYIWSWNSVLSPNGSYTITAMGFDAAGNSSISSAVAVTVSNQAASIALVQRSSRTTSSAQNLTLTLPSAVTVGNLIVVSMSGWPNLPAATAVTDSLGNIYNRAGSVLVSQGAYSAIYYAVNARGGANSVTVRTVSSGGQISMVVAEFSGIDTAAPLDRSAGATGSGTTPSSGNMTPTLAGDLVIGSGTHNGTSVTIAGTGFTMIAIATEDSNTHQPLAVEYRILAGAEQTAATFNTATGYGWTQNGALFKHR